MVVVGGGVAGVAAAWAAKGAGARTTLLHAGAGASMLYSGALDMQISPDQAAATELSLFATDLGNWEYGEDACRIATATGLSRQARGRDSALLDLEPLAGKRIGVVDALHASWDAKLVVRELSASAWSQETKTQFFALSAPELITAAELALPLYDLAKRFDEAARVRGLIKLLADARDDADGFLLGPWLGLETNVAQLAADEVGAAVGETTSGPGGAAGARFERARDQLLSDSAIEAQRTHVKSVQPSPRGFIVSADGEELDADAVVLAIGGVAAGGIVLDDARPEHPGGACFHPSLQAPVALQLDGRPVERVSTLHGVDFCLAGMDTLERVGIAAPGGKTPYPDLYVAGDCVADGPRTVLDAAVSGIAVGRLAAEPAPG